MEKLDLLTQVFNQKDDGGVLIVCGNRNIHAIFEEIIKLTKNAPEIQQGMFDVSNNKTRAKSVMYNGIEFHFMNYFDFEDNFRLREDE